MIERVPPDDRHEHSPPPDPASLRHSGRRLTRQRQAIWDVLLADPDAHLSAEDVVERARAQLPSVNTSTIYRTLELLVDEGLLLRTDLGADRAYYEPARDHAHHHVICERCGKVSHLHEETLGDLRGRIERASGYVVGNREISFFGLCEECRLEPRELATDVRTTTQGGSNEHHR
jgi:Fur family transcriptional regulator, ferric uptake regulator